MMVALLMAIGSVYAQSVSFNLDEEASSNAGVDAQAVENGLGGQIADRLGLADPGALLDKYANAGAMAMKGMGVDYATNPKKFSVGGVVGSSVSGVPLGFGRGDGDLPSGGYAFMASAYGGVNLGMFVPGDDHFLDRVSLYVNGLAFSPPNNRNFRGRMYNFGAHAQIKLLETKTIKIIEWGGLDLTTGYERTFYRLELTQGLPLSQQVDGNDVTWTATGDYNIEASAGSVPLELSTNLRLFVLTAYVGGAADIAFARAASAATLSGPVDASLDGGRQALGDIALSLSGEGRSDPVFGRAFVGAQVNLLMLKLFGHLNLGSNQTYGGFVGVRVAM